MDAAAPQAPLVLEPTIALPDVSGQIGRMTVDLWRERLFVAEFGINCIDVVDVVGRRVIAVANARDGTARLFRGEDFAPAGRADLGDDTDNIRLETHSSSVL